MINRPITYTLESNGVTYTNEHINASVITDLINELNDYIVLAPSEPLDHTIYIQVAVLGNDELVIETRLLELDQRFRHYSYLPANRKEVIHILLAYWGQQQIPDLSQWQDITAEFE